MDALALMRGIAYPRTQEEARERDQRGYVVIGDHDTTTADLQGALNAFVGVVCPDGVPELRAAFAELMTEVSGMSALVKQFANPDPVTGHSGTVFRDILIAIRPGDAFALQPGLYADPEDDAHTCLLFAREGQGEHVARNFLIHDRTPWFVSLNECESVEGAWTYQGVRAI